GCQEKSSAGRADDGNQGESRSNCERTHCAAGFGHGSSRLLSAPIIAAMGSSPTVAPFEADQDATPYAPHLRIHAVNIYVRDQDRSLRFFMDQLGFELAFDALLQSGERWVAVSPPDGSALLTLIAPKPDSRDQKLIGRPTGVVFATEDVTA